MAILSWPTGIRNPATVHFAPAANTQSGGRSPFDGTEQTLELPGARWMAEFRWPRFPEVEWRLMQAFIASLGGRAGRFSWGPTHMPRRGTLTGTPVVSGAGQTGKALVTSSWATSGGLPAFLAGDMLSYVDATGRPVLHMVTADATANGAGVSTLAIAPAIRRSPVNGSSIEIAAPKAVWKLTADDAGLDYERGIFASLTLQIELAIF